MYPSLAMACNSAAISGVMLHRGRRLGRAIQRLTMNLLEPMQEGGPLTRPRLGGAASRFTRVGLALKCAAPSAWVSQSGSET